MTLQRKFWVEVSRCSYLSSRTNYSQKWAWCYFTFVRLWLAGLHIRALLLANTPGCVRVPWEIITQRFAGLNLIRIRKNIQQCNYLLTGCCHGEMKLIVRTVRPQPVLSLSNSHSDLLISEYRTSARASKEASTNPVTLIYFINVLKGLKSSRQLHHQMWRGRLMPPL